MQKFVKSAANAIRGLQFVWSRERNFRIECLAAFGILALAVLSGFSYAEVMALIVASAVVLVAELLNTMVEEILDVVEPHYTVHVGRLKDVTSGTVLLLSLFAAVIGALTIVHHFWPQVWARIIFG